MPTEPTATAPGGDQDRITDSAAYGTPGTRTSVLRHPNSAAANWHPVPIKGIVGYRCPICSTRIDGYTDEGPTTDIRTGDVVAPKRRTFKPCKCVVADV